MKILCERKATWAHKGDKENVNLIFEAFVLRRRDSRNGLQLHFIKRCEGTVHKLGHRRCIKLSENCFHNKDFQVYQQYVQAFLALEEVSNS